jgi:adenylate cyclase class 2
MVGEPPQETEVKLRLDDIEAGRVLAAQLGAFLVQPRHFEDNFLFDDATRSLAGRGALIRLRATPWAATLTYKGPREVVEGAKRREELESGVEDAEAVQQMLGRLGLRRVFRYQKYREVYELDDVELVIDETPIGIFMEIEGPLEAIHRTADALGFGAESYVVESYSALFAAAGGEGDMVFE